MISEKISGNSKLQVAYERDIGQFFTAEKYAFTAEERDKTKKSRKGNGLFVVVFGEANPEMCTNRIEAALKLTKSDYFEKIILVGTKSEVKLMAEVARSGGVDAEDMAVVGKSINTIDNAHYALQELKDADAIRVMVVTADFEIRRAMDAWKYLQKREAPEAKFITEPLYIRTNISVPRSLLQKALLTTSRLQLMLYSSNHNAFSIGEKQFLKFKPSLYEGSEENYKEMNENKAK
jgi:hypothetical protein